MDGSGPAMGIEVSANVIVIVIVMVIVIDGWVRLGHGN